MIRKICLLLALATLLAPALLDAQSQSQTQPNIALLNGQWFNGRSFESRTFYSVGSRFTTKKPGRIDRTLDLAGLWVVPPFAEAHNHNLNGNEERDRQAIQKYLADGVFYVKLPGNFFVSDELKRSYRLNQPDGIDVAMAQGASFTSTGGHPYRLAEEVWLRFGYTKRPVEALNGYRFFTIDSESDLEEKWPRALAQRPDFIKTMLWASGEHAERKNNPAFRGEYGLDPHLLPKIVARAHAAGLRVTTHVNDATDFHVALTAGADEIAHLPLTGHELIPIADVQFAARHGIAVITTSAIVPRLSFIPKADLPQALKTQAANLKLLHAHGVRLAIGSDNPPDSSVMEAEYLQKLGVFDNLTLLKMWTETTPQTIFPKRKLGALAEGYEASFLALAGNPLEDWQNVRRIKLRFKQGTVLEP